MTKKKISVMAFTALILAGIVCVLVLNGGVFAVATPGTSIACGYSHTIALKYDGSVWTWGYNNIGQLGDGTTYKKTIPGRVSGLSGVMAISGGYSHTIALKNDGTVWAWGSNGIGQLGDGTTINRSTPVQVSNLNGISAIAGGDAHTAALKNDGMVWMCHGVSMPKDNWGMVQL